MYSDFCGLKSCFYDIDELELTKSKQYHNYELKLLYAQAFLSICD